MNAPITRKGPQALDIKSAKLHTVRLVLHSADTQELLQALDQRMHEAGAFFQDEPVVIDSSALHETIDWTTLIQALRQHQLHPIGVCAHPEQEAQALQAGLTAVDLALPRATQSIPEPTELDPTPNLSPTKSAPPIPPQPLRSAPRCLPPAG